VRGEWWPLAAGGPVMIAEFAPHAVVIGPHVQAMADGAHQAVTHHLAAGGGLTTKPALAWAKRMLVPAILFVLALKVLFEARRGVFRETTHHFSAILPGLLLLNFAINPGQAIAVIGWLGRMFTGG
jgi:hypothetical protein